MLLVSKRCGPSRRSRRVGLDPDYKKTYTEIKQLKLIFGLSAEVGTAAAIPGS
jgi:hypothetical protein